MYITWSDRNDGYTEIFDEPSYEHGCFFIYGNFLYLFKPNDQALVIFGR